MLLYLFFYSLKITQKNHNGRYKAEKKKQIDQGKDSEDLKSDQKLGWQEGWINEDLEQMGPRHSWRYMQSEGRDDTCVSAWEKRLMWVT